MTFLGIPVDFWVAGLGALLGIVLAILLETY